MTLDERLKELERALPVHKKLINKSIRPITKIVAYIALFGNIAPGGALLKTAGIEEGEYFRGKARVFTREEICQKALK